MFLAATGIFRTRLVPSSFRPLLTQDERSLIVSHYGGTRFNGKTVRLEGLEQAGGQLELLLSPSCYFDLLSTNLLLSATASQWSPEARQLQERLRNEGEYRGAATQASAHPLQSLARQRSRRIHPAPYA